MRQDLQLNVKAEDSPQHAHRAVDVATRTAQDQTQQLHDVHLKAKTTRERIAAPALGTRKKEEKDKGGGGERSRIQQEREHFNTPNKSALNTSEDPFPSPHDMLSICNDTYDATLLHVTPIVLPLNASITYQSNLVFMM